MATLVVDLLNSVGDLDLLVQIIKSNQNNVLSVLFHCRDYVTLSPSGLQLAPNFVYLSTIVTKVFGAFCRQYQHFLLDALKYLRENFSDCFYEIFSNPLGATSLLILLKDDFSMYSKLFSLQFLLKSAQKCEAGSFALYCIEMGKVLSLGSSETEKDFWVQRVFGQDLYLEHEVEWMQLLFNIEKAVHKQHEDDFDSNSKFNAHVFQNEMLTGHENVKRLFDCEYYSGNRRSVSILASSEAPETSFFVCDSQKLLIAQLVNNLSCCQPVLICGPSCCGKSSIINFLTQTIG